MRFPSQMILWLHLRICIVLLLLVSWLLFIFIWGKIYAKASTCIWEENCFLQWPLSGHFHTSTTFYLSIIILFIHMLIYIQMNLKLKTQENLLHLIFIYILVLLKIDTGGKLTTQLYDKREYFNFSIVNIQSSPAHGVYILPLIRYARLCSSKFLNRGRLLTHELMLQGVLVSS
jgi:hypothetical protein